MTQPGRIKFVRTPLNTEGSLCGKSMVTRDPLFAHVLCQQRGEHSLHIYESASGGRYEWIEYHVEFPPLPKEPQ